MSNPRLDRVDETLRARFEDAVQYASQSEAYYNSVEKLKLYSFYKQATEGDCTRPKPSKVKLVQYTKWKAWNVLKGMSPSTCMKQYIDVIVGKEPHLSQVFDYNQKDNLLGPLKPKDLNRLPKLNLAHKNQNLNPRDATRISHVVGVNPFMGKEEDPRRIELYDRLRRFYEKYNKEVLKDGIGHLVDYGIEFGEAELNEKLRKTYGKDLKAMEEDSNRIKAILSVRETKHEKLQLDAIDAETDPIKKQTRKKLYSFFKVVDPYRLEKSFQPLLDFIDDKGIEALNERLYDKYSEDLSTVKAGNKGETLKKAKKENKAGKKNTLQRINNGNTIKKFMTSPWQKSPGKDLKPQEESAKFKQTKRTSPSPNSNNPGEADPAPSPGSNYSNYIKENFDNHPKTPGNLKSPRMKGPPPPGMSNDQEQDQGSESNLIPGRKHRKHRKHSNNKDTLAAKRKNTLNKNTLVKNKTNKNKVAAKYLQTAGTGPSMESLGAEGTGNMNSNNLKVEYTGEVGAAVDTLPKDCYQMLTNYYAKYEPKRIIDGGVDSVYAWATRNGFDMLNRELKKRFNESLREFMARSELLRDELETFYSKYDEKMLTLREQGIDRVFNWAMRNGRNALNKKLFERYKLNLDSDSDDPKATPQLVF